MSKTRSLYILLAALMCAGILLSGLYVIAESGHNCIGENCRICNMICLCGDFLRSIFAVGAIVGALIFAKVFACFCSNEAKRPVYFSDTLVSLKVEFRN